MPMMSGLGPGYPYRRMHEMVTAFARDHAIRCVDLLPAFESMDEHQLWVHPLDQHPNDAGHARIAAGVDGYLRGEGLLR